MSRDGHTGPRWLKDKDDPPGFVKDAQTGMYYLRRNFSRGPGEKPQQVVRSLRTKSKAEALRRFDIESGRARARIEKVRPTTDKENVAYWRSLRATGGKDAEAAYDAEIARVLGSPVREDADERGEPGPVYDARREAAALALTGLVDGKRVPVEFYVDVQRRGKRTPLAG